MLTWPNPTGLIVSAYLPDRPSKSRVIPTEYQLRSRKYSTCHCVALGLSHPGLAFFSAVFLYNHHKVTERVPAQVMGASKECPSTMWNLRNLWWRTIFCFPNKWLKEAELFRVWIDHFYIFLSTGRFREILPAYVISSWKEHVQRMF